MRGRATPPLARALALAARLSLAAWLGCAGCCFEPVGTGGSSNTSGPPPGYTGPSSGLGACESPGEAQPSGVGFCGDVDNCARSNDAGCPSLICPNCSSAEGTILSNQSYYCAHGIAYLYCGTNYYQCLLDAGSLSPPCSKGLQELVAGLFIPNGVDFCNAVDACARGGDAGCPSLIDPNCSSMEGNDLSGWAYYCGQDLHLSCGSNFYECLLDAGSLSPACSRGLHELVAGLPLDAGR